MQSRANLLRLAVLIALVMLAFAANSLLCRLALQTTQIDPATFSTLRIVSGALTLWFVSSLRNIASPENGSWQGAVALLIYVVGFSYAYMSLAVGTGTLLLFGAVQLTMITAGLLAGERLRRIQVAGLIIAIAGLVILVLPGVQTPGLSGSLLMTASGIAWGVYSLSGRHAADPIASTAGHFLRASPLAVLLSLFAWPWFDIDVTGTVYALLSGAIASGLGYILWYQVVRELNAIRGAAVQMAAPLLAALGGMLFLNEPMTMNFVVASTLMLGGIWLVLKNRHSTRGYSE